MNNSYNTCGECKFRKYNSTHKAHFCTMSGQPMKVTATERKCWEFEPKTKKP